MHLTNLLKGERRHNGNTEIVAVKVLKETASREAEEDFMREVDIMSSFKHKNILTLIGVVLRDCGNNPCMVFEYMPYGDLTNVLRNNSPQRNSIPGLKPLTKVQLIVFPSRTCYLQEFKPIKNYIEI